MEIPGFRQALIKARKKEMDENPNLTSPEATATVAIDALNASYQRIEDLGGATFGQIEEIKKRTKLIKKSPAYRTASEKVFS